MHDQHLTAGFCAFLPPQKFTQTGPRHANRAQHAATPCLFLSARPGSAFAGQASRRDPGEGRNHIIVRGIAGYTNSADHRTAVVA